MKKSLKLVVMFLGMMCILWMSTCMAATVTIKSSDIDPKSLSNLFQAKVGDVVNIQTSSLTLMQCSDMETVKITKQSGSYQLKCQKKGYVRVIALIGAVSANVTIRISDANGSSSPDLTLPFPIDESVPFGNMMTPMNLDKVQTEVFKQPVKIINITYNTGVGFPVSSTVENSTVRVTIQNSSYFKASGKLLITPIRNGSTYMLLEEIDPSGKAVLQDIYYVTISNPSLPSGTSSNTGTSSGTGSSSGASDDSSTGLKVVIKNTSQAYTGSPVTPAVDVRYNGKAITNYEVTYSNNIDIGTAYATVTGAYVDENGKTQRFTEKVPFRIVNVDNSSGLTFIIHNSAPVYTGKPITPSITVAGLGGVTVIDYKITYSNNVEVGTAYATVTGTYMDENGETQPFTQKLTFKIVSPEVTVLTTSDDLKITMAATDFPYTGSPITPTINVYYKGAKLSGVEVRYMNNTKVGKASAVVSGSYVNGNKQQQSFNNIVYFNIVEATTESNTQGGESTTETIVTEPVTVEPTEGTAPTGETTGTPATEGTTSTGETTGTPATEGTTSTGETTGTPATEGTNPTGETTGTQQPTEGTTPTGETTGTPTTEETTQEASAKIPFKDVKKSDWFYDAVCFVYEKNLFNGISNTEFDPNGEMTRGMLVTVLYRLDGANENSYSTYSDVRDTSYYSHAIAWAAKHEVVYGIGNNLFAPDNVLTRQDLATIITRYINYVSLKLKDSKNAVTNFIDSADISDYAASSVIFMAQKGLLQGRTNGRFDPKGYGTRAEVASIMMRIFDAS